MKNQIKRRGHIQAGYKAYTGRKLHKHICEQYNRIQDTINGWIDAGREVPAHLLNESHLVFHEAATNDWGGKL